MDHGAARVWWLYGAPCVGKSVTAWQLHADLLRDEPCGYFDVDQLGICYPEPHDDAARSLLKVRAAAVLIDHLVRAGARTVVVSGVLDPGAHERLVAALPGTEVTFCRLRADVDVLRPRLRRRYGPDDVDRALAEARAWDERDDGHAVVDSTAEPSEVAGRVLRALQQARPSVAPTGAASSAAPQEPGADRRPRAVLLCGARGVGASTVAFGLTMRAWSTGRTCAFLDLRQISFLRGVTRGRVEAVSATAAAVADLWRVFSAAGAADLVLNGDLRSAEEADVHRAALGQEALLVVRLSAGPRRAAPAHRGPRPRGGRTRAGRGRPPRPGRRRRRVGRRSSLRGPGARRRGGGGRRRRAERRRGAGGGRRARRAAP